jgi:hypothetical protein
MGMLEGPKEARHEEESKRDQQKQGQEGMKQ